MAPICQRILELLVVGMVIGLVLAVGGAVALFVGLVIGVVALGASPGVITAIFVTSPSAGIAVFGLVTLILGLTLFFLLATLYVLASLLCSAALGGVRLPAPFGGHTDPKDAPARDGCESDPLCRFGPLLPAGAFLAVTLIVLTILIARLGVAGVTTTTPGAGLPPASVLTAVTVVLVAFGLLLALAPVIWCCCCKPRADWRDLLGPLAKPLADAFDAASGAITGTIGAGAAAAGSALNSGTAFFSNTGQQLHDIGTRLTGLQIWLRNPDPETGFREENVIPPAVHQIGVDLQELGAALTNAGPLNQGLRARLTDAATKLRTAAAKARSLSAP